MPAHSGWTTGSIFIALTLCAGLSSAQPTDPIPPPLTPQSPVTNLNSATGTVRVKASPDECWSGLGQNTKFDFVNQQNPAMPCNTGQIPKVNQGYIWGSAVVGTQVFFGTFANPDCVGSGSGGETVPYQAGDYFACEFRKSPYAIERGGPYPGEIGDLRPARMYIYDAPNHTVRDITPRIGSATQSSPCGLLDQNGWCTERLWNLMTGVRAVVSYTDAGNGQTYVIISGPQLGAPRDSTVFFVWGVTENRWVGKYSLTGYSDVRKWVVYQNTLYATAFKPGTAGGALLRYTGNFSIIPPSNPTALNGYDAVPDCGTASTANPPAGNSFCIAFQEVGSFDTPASEVVAASAGITDSGRLFVGTWPPHGNNPQGAVGGIYMGPVVPAGGLAPDNASQWTKVWTAANYDPDPLLQTTYGTGAMSFFNGELYWGTLNPTLVAVNTIFTKYGKPKDQATRATDLTNANRTAVLFRGKNFSTGAPSIDLLYGAASLWVFSPPTLQSPNGTWSMQPNNVARGACTTACGTPPLYGQPGFNNFWTNYMWSMAVSNSRLYVGTMNWEFLANQLAAAFNLTVPPTLSFNPATYGAGLYYFADNSSPAIAVSTSGVGNFLNYGIRSILPYGSSTLFIGTANPMNLATTGTTNVPNAGCSVDQCRGGWELIEIDPSNP